MPSFLTPFRDGLIVRGMQIPAERTDLLAGIAYGVVLFVTVFVAAGALP